MGQSTNDSVVLPEHLEEVFPRSGEGAPDHVLHLDYVGPLGPRTLIGWVRSEIDAKQREYFLAGAESLRLFDGRVVCPSRNFDRQKSIDDAVGELRAAWYKQLGPPATVEHRSPDRQFKSE